MGESGKGASAPAKYFLMSQWHSSYVFGVGADFSTFWGKARRFPSFGNNMRLVFVNQALVRRRSPKRYLGCSFDGGGRDRTVIGVQGASRKRDASGEKTIPSSGSWLRSFVVRTTAPRSSAFSQAAFFSGRLSASRILRSCHLCREFLAIQVSSSTPGFTPQYPLRRLSGGALVWGSFQPRRSLREALSCWKSPYFLDLDRERVHFAGLGKSLRQSSGQVSVSGFVQSRRSLREALS